MAEISKFQALHKDMIEKHQMAVFFSEKKNEVEDALNKVSFLCPSNREGGGGGGQIGFGADPVGAGICIASFRTLSSEPVDGY